MKLKALLALMGADTTIFIRDEYDKYSYYGQVRYVYDSLDKDVIDNADVLCISNLLKSICINTNIPYER